MPSFPHGNRCQLTQVVKGTATLGHLQRTTFLLAQEIENAHVQSTIAEAPREPCLGSEERQYLPTVKLSGSTPNAVEQDRAEKKAALEVVQHAPRFAGGKLKRAGCETRADGVIA